MNPAYPLALMAVVVAGYLYRNSSMFALDGEVVDFILSMGLVISWAWLAVQSVLYDERNKLPRQYVSERYTLAFQYGKALRRFLRLVGRGFTSR